MWNDHKVLITAATDKEKHLRFHRECSITINNKTDSQSGSQIVHVSHGSMTKHNKEHNARELTLIAVLELNYLNL